MMFLEVFVSQGVLDERGRTRLSDRMIAALIEDEGAPAEVIDAARSLTQVVIHEPRSWTVGGEAHDGKPRYLVRVTVPSSWNGHQMNRHIIASVTRALADLEDEPDSLFREARAWVQVLGLREGSLGAFGAPISTSEITKLITQEYRQPGTPAPEVDPDTARDPVCGMTVPWAEATLTLEYEGITYAFCAPGCRTVFAEERAIPA